MNSEDAAKKNSERKRAPRKFSELINTKQFRLALMGLGLLTVLIAGVLTKWMGVRKDKVQKSEQFCESFQNGDSVNLNDLLRDADRLKITYQILNYNGEGALTPQDAEIIPEGFQLQFQETMGAIPKRCALKVQNGIVVEGWTFQP